MGTPTPSRLLGRRRSHRTSGARPSAFRLGLQTRFPMGTTTFARYARSFGQASPAKAVPPKLRRSEGGLSLTPRTRPKLAESAIAVPTLFENSRAPERPHRPSRL